MDHAEVLILMLFNPLLFFPSHIDPYGYAALEQRQQDLEMALHQRQQALASQLQVEEEMNCKLSWLLLFALLRILLPIFEYISHAFNIV